MALIRISPWMSELYSKEFKKNQIAKEKSLDGRSTLLSNAKMATRNFIFLVDSSSSMIGDKIENSKAALFVCLKPLPKDSYFNMASFGSDESFLFSKAVLVEDSSITAAIKFVRELKADSKKSLLKGALKKLIEEIEAERVHLGKRWDVFMISDWLIDNIEELKVLKAVVDTNIVKFSLLGFEGTIKNSILIIKKT